MLTTLAQVQPTVIPEANAWFWYSIAIGSFAGLISLIAVIAVWFSRNQNKMSEKLDAIHIVQREELVRANQHEKDIDALKEKHERLERLHGSDYAGEIAAKVVTLIRQ